MDHIKNLTEDEAWEYCIREYENSNPITKFLIDNFFSSISEITKSWEASDRILEVGCGAGRSSIRLNSMLAPKYFEASENDPRYVSRLIKEQLPFKITQESVYDMQRGDREFDHVIMLEVLEHLEDPIKALTEIARVTKKSFIISVPHEPIWCMLNLARGKYVSDFGNTPGHINHWHYWSLHKLLSKYGRVVVTKLPLPWLIFEVRKA